MLFVQHHVKIHKHTSGHYVVVFLQFYLHKKRTCFYDPRRIREQTTITCICLGLGQEFKAVESVILLVLKSESTRPYITCICADWVSLSFDKLRV